MRLLAGIVGGAFFLAVNYCACEAVAHEHPDQASSHQHAPAGHHDESPSNEEYNPCCTNLQAIVTPQLSLHLATISHQLFQAIALPVADAVSLADLSLAPSGLSPPAREPTTPRPFYRTTFASHAPPVSLA